MFDLISGTMERPLRERAPGSKATSIVVHIVVVTLVFVIPLLRVTNTLPELQTMMGFVAAPLAPPPPPPPPRSPAPVRPAETRPVVQPAPENPRQLTAPFETPTDLRTEATTGSTSTGDGVEGGVEGGVPGGIVGGIISSAPPPPPPPPAPVVAVRIGGQIEAPALVHRVEPVYPTFAAKARMVGTVVLEAVVDVEGYVESVTTLRSRHLLLDTAAIAALRQWRYTPLVLNGIPTPFILTVTITFTAR